MNVEFAERFYKDLDALKEKKLKKKIAEVIDECKNARLLVEVRNVKKLEGYKSYYRIRVGDYRIGIELDGERLMFLRIANRKDIYKIFP